MKPSLSLPILLLTIACASPSGESEGSATGQPNEVGLGISGSTDWTPHKEVVQDFGKWVPEHAPRPGSRTKVERVTSGVPWPRGITWVDGEMIVLARGRHRRNGGVDASIEDQSGSLFRVDPGLSEPVVPGKLASPEIRGNARLLARPHKGTFNLFDGKGRPVEDRFMDRPYCTLIYDEASKNLFICGFSGVDLKAARFRKNATDSIHRYDMRVSRWFPVEMHDALSVPVEELGRTTPNQYYPHHDPATNRAPHGFLNGPDGGCVAGDYLYCVGKDNHVVARYELAEMRKNPEAGPPQAEVAVGPRVLLKHPQGLDEVELLGPSGARAHGGYLYLAYRTSSVVVRFPIDETGRLPENPVAELVAVFEPWSPKTGRSANVIDLALNSKGELFVACAKEGRVWKVGKPDPARPFYGNDQDERPTSSAPFVDLRKLSGKRFGVGNLNFDPMDRLYICVGAYDNGDRIAGAVYRIVEEAN